MKRRHSIKNKIIFSYSILIGMILFSGFAAFFYLEKSKIRKDYDDKAENLQFLLSELFQADQDFFRFSSIDTSFYQEKESKELLRRTHIREEVNREIKGLQQFSYQELDYQEQPQKIERYISAYNLLMDTVINKVLKRGFKDYGLEGQMRYHAHWLEDSSFFISNKDLLMLRRHEKDYMLRKDTIYIQQLNGLSNNLLHNLSASSADFQHLKAYQKNFYVLTTLEAEIGVDEESGMRNQINAYREKIKLSLSLLLKSSKSIAIKIVEYGIKVFFVAMVSFLLITFWLGWDIWKNTARPLTLLTAISDDYHKTPSDISLKPFNCEVNEISKLHSSFINLIQDLEVLIERSNQANTELAEQNRRLTKINQELDMFVYSASHDLRAPMTSLMGLVQLCQGEEDQEECQSYYTFMQERIKELDRYIMDIIDYSRNNRQEMNIEQLDLEVLINETIQQYAYHENFKMMRIIKKVHCEEPCYNDGFRLGIIFKNLISNAIKYSDLDKEENTLNITIKVSQGYINMEFSDTGIGIPEDKTNRIFNIFFRAHAQSKGSGLGLYIVKETVEKIGGEITVSSKPGKGTIFKVRIKNCQLQTKNSLLVYA